MRTEAEIIADIRAIADAIRDRGDGAEETREEHDASVILKQELYDLRHPPPPPIPPPTAEQIRRKELQDKLRVEDLSLIEVNELARLGGLGI